MIEDEEFFERSRFFPRMSAEAMQSLTITYVDQIKQLKDRLDELSPSLVENEPYFDFLERVTERAEVWKSIELTKSILGDLIVENFDIVNFGVAHGDKVE